RSSPNVFEMAATETITSIILIKLIRVSLGTVRHPRRFKIVVIDIQITLKQMLRDFIGIRVNRAKKSGMVNITSSVNSRRSEERFSRNAETDLVCRLLLEKKNEQDDERQPDLMRYTDHELPTHLPEPRLLRDTLAELNET